jgi:hypothetical protein
VRHAAFPRLREALTALSPDQGTRYSTDCRRGVVVGEVQAARLAIDAEDGDIVAALVQAIEELAGGVEVETTLIVSAGPFVADVRQSAVRADREDTDAVVQPGAGVEESAVG